MCLDTLGHMVDGHVGIYSCHGTGGNQVPNDLVSFYVKTKRLYAFKVSVFNSNFLGVVFDQVREHKTLRPVFVSGGS